tara:strand:- start:1774 stop:1965 length:192 start_codon:yes stop_codon:yes gene_type:complete
MKINSIAINPDEYLSKARQKELIILADAGLPYSTIRTAIREAVYAVKPGIIVEAEEETKKDDA